MIPGIDVNQWQSEIDWREVRRSGVKFAFIQATEFPERKTTLLVDNQMQGNIHGAQVNGIHWGAVHTFRSHIDPVLQARIFCETVGGFRSLPPVMAINGAGTRGERLNYKVRLFLDEVLKISGRQAIIHTSPGFWTGFMAYEKRSHTDWANAYPLWMTQFTTLWPNPIYPWLSWDFWRYSDKGRLPGIRTDVNLNWFAGSEQDLLERWVENEQAEPPVYVFEDEEHGRVSVAINKEPAISQPAANDNFRGDYQEETDESLQSAGFKPIIKSSSPKYSSDQQNWIREYFF